MAEPWYTQAEPSGALADKAKQIATRQSWRKARILHELRLFGDRNIAGMTPAAYTRVAGGARQAEYEPLRRISLNVVRSCVEAATSQLLQNTPRVTYLTRAGDFSLRRRAKKRTAFAEGLMHAGGFYRARRRALKSMCLHGTGAIKVLERFGEVRYEPTFIGELLVDDYDGINQEPRELIQEKVYDRQVLKALYPSKRAAIDREASAEQSYFGRDPMCDQILVREAWRLPSKPGGKDGKHAICIEGETLFSQRWEDDGFPFIFERWSDEPLGFWATGLGYELTGLQLEINQLLHMVQNNMYLGGNLKILIERGANIIKSHLSNTLRGAVIEFSGNPPKFEVHDLVSNQILQHLWNLVDRSFNITGISQLAAQGVMPSGLSGSGRSQLVYAHTTSQRFLTVAQNDEEAVREAARLGVQAARRIRDRGEQIKVALRNRNWMELTSAEEALDGDDDEFYLQSYVTSILSRTPPGLLAIAEQYVGAGMLDPTQAKRALEDMDLDAETSLDLAPSELIDRRIEKILEDGRAGFVAPHPRMDLATARKRATLAYARAELENVDPENIDLLGQWIDTIDDLEKRAAAAAAPPPGPAPVPPPTPGLPVEVPPIPPEVAASPAAAPATPGASELPIAS